MESPSFETSPSNEDLRKFIYKDNFKDGQVVFECVASDILEADEKYKEATGNDVIEQPNIACSIEKVKEDASEQ